MGLRGWGCGQTAVSTHGGAAVDLLLGEGHPAIKVGGSVGLIMWVNNS